MNSQDSGIGMSELVQHYCDTGTVDGGARAALLKRFGRIGAASSAETIRIELAKLRITIIRCIDSHLSGHLSCPEATTVDVRSLLLSEPTADPVDIVGIVNPDHISPDMIDPLLDLLAMVRAVDEFERESRSRGTSHISRAATRSSQTIAYHERWSDSSTGNDDAGTAAPASSQENGLFQALGNFKGTKNTAALLRYLNNRGTRPIIENSPGLISRSLYILSTTQVDEQTRQEHAACVEWLCAAGNQEAVNFPQVATSVSLLGLAKMPYSVNGQSGPFVESMLFETVRQSRTLDVRTIRTSLWSLSRMNYPFEDIQEFVEHVCQQGINQIEEFDNPQAISNCILSLAHIGATGTVVHAFVTSLCQRAVDLIGDDTDNEQHHVFNTQELNNSLWGLTRLGTIAPAVDAFTRLAVQEMQSQIEVAEPRHTSGVMWALAHRSMRNGDEYIRHWPETVTFFSEACQQPVASFSARDMANSLWALASMGHSFTDAFAEDMHAFVRSICHEAVMQLALYSPERRFFEPQEISKCLWSLAHIGTKGIEVQKFIDAAYVYGQQYCDEFSEQHANNSSWGLAVLSDEYMIPEQGEVFLNRSEQLLNDDRPQSVRQLYHANLALRGYANSDLQDRVRTLDLRELFADEARVGGTEERLVQWLQTETNPPVFLDNTPYHGFQMDLLSGDTSVNVEIDGPHHKDRPEIDAFRDRILDLLGIRVIRVPEEAAYEFRFRIRNTLLEHMHVPKFSNTNVEKSA